MPGMPTSVNAGDTAVTYSKRSDMGYECSEAIKDLHLTGNLNIPSGLPFQAGFFATGINATVDWIIIVSRAP